MLKKIILLILVIFMVPAGASAFWVWTPETNKWINPKYSVKETPDEQLQYAKSFLAEKDYEKAMAEFKKLIKYYPKAREAAQAQFYMGTVLDEQGKYYEAFKAYQMVIDKYPFSDLAPEIIKKQFAIGNNILEGREKRSGFINAVTGDSYHAIEVFKAVIKNAPYGEYAAVSQYKIGLYLQEQQLYQESRDEFEKVMNDYPASEWAKAAHYQIALVDSQRSTKPQYDQTVTKVAVEEFKEFVKTNPDAELSAKAQAHIQTLREKEAENNFLIARFYEKQKEYDSAKIYYNTVVKDFAATKWASQALKRLRRINDRIAQD